MPMQKAAPIRVTAVLRRAEAMDLRRAGMTFDQIATRMGFTGKSARSRAYNLVREGMAAALQEPAEDLRAMENERLDALQLAHWRDAINPSADAETRVAATRTILSIMERRAKLNGLDQPMSMKIALEAGQIDFMETTVRGLVDGIFSALASAGHEVAAAEVQEVVFGEVLPRVLEAAATGPATATVTR